MGKIIIVHVLHMPAMMAVPVLLPDIRDFRTMAGRYGWSV